MGGGNWSKGTYSNQTATRSAFQYNSTVKASTPQSMWTAHDDLQPTKRREARDSDDHPESVPVAVFFDVTGSMGMIPELLRKKLPTLLEAILKGGALEHPQIMFGAVGDAYTDRVPLQISQFESSNVLDDHLDKIFLEGNGGGQGRESYEMALYFMAHYVDADSWEKRGKKGYVFVIGDEGHYTHLDSHQFNTATGFGLEANVPFAEVAEQVQEKWETFILRPEEGTGYAHDQSIINGWKDHFGERVIQVPKMDLISEFIAGIIAQCEGIDVATVLAAGGATSNSTDIVLRATSQLVGASSGGAVATVSGEFDL